MILLLVRGWVVAWTVFLQALMAYQVAVAKPILSESAKPTLDRMGWLCYIDMPGNEEPNTQGQKHWEDPRRTGEGWYCIREAVANFLASHLVSSLLRGDSGWIYDHRGVTD